MNKSAFAIAAILTLAAFPASAREYSYFCANDDGEVIRMDVDSVSYQYSIFEAERQNIYVKSKFTPEIVDDVPLLADRRPVTTIRAIRAVVMNTLPNPKPIIVIIIEDKDNAALTGGDGIRNLVYECRIELKT